MREAEERETRSDQSEPARVAAEPEAPGEPAAVGTPAPQRVAYGSIKDVPVSPVTYWRICTMQDISEGWASQ